MAIASSPRPGHDSQQADEPDDPYRPDNLRAPVAGDHGADGRCGDRAAHRSLQTWINERLPALAMICVAGAALFMGARGWRTV